MMGTSEYRSFFCSVTPSVDLCEPSLIPLRGQAEAKTSFLRIDIYQDQRPDLELSKNRQRVNAGKHTVAWLSTFNGRVFVDAEDCSNWRRLADNTDISGLKHDNKGERTPGIARGLPKRDGDRAVGGTRTGGRIAFCDPLVRSELLPRGQRCRFERLNGAISEQENCCRLSGAPDNATRNAEPLCL